jgi:hypothetical protein
MAKGSSPAFPGGSYVNSNYDMVADGMTLREYFAIQALTPAAYIWRGSAPDKAAKYAVELAEALLAELAK